MKRPLFLHFRPVTVAASAALLAAALLAAPVARAQSPSPTAEPTEARHDGSADIFDAIKKGADKLQKQAKDASKIEPQLKQLEDRQAEFMKHQAEAERRLTEVLIAQEGEIRKLTATVESLANEIKADRTPAAATPAAPLPATEPPAPTKAAATPEPDAKRSGPGIGFMR